MENQIYRVSLADDKTDLEFGLSNTNDVDPYRDKKEIELKVFNNKKRVYGYLEEKELESLIKYLSDSLKYINNFNENSKPYKTDID